MNAATKAATSLCPRSDSAASCNACRPALGPGRQCRHRRIRQGRRRVLEQRRCLRGREPQVGHADFGQLAACPQPRQRQRRVAAAGQHHAYPGGPAPARKASDAAPALHPSRGSCRVHTTASSRPDDRSAPLTSSWNRRVQRGRAEQRGRPGRRSRGGPGRGRPPRGARTGPGRCPPRPVRARRPARREPAARRAGPSPPARPSCRIRPGRRPVPAPAPGPHQAGPAAAAAIPGRAWARGQVQLGGQQDIALRAVTGHSAIADPHRSTPPRSPLPRGCGPQTTAGGEPKAGDEEASQANCRPPL